MNISTYNHIKNRECVLLIILVAVVDAKTVDDRRWIDGSMTIDGLLASVDALVKFWTVRGKSFSLRDNSIAIYRASNPPIELNSYTYRVPNSNLER